MAPVSVSEYLELSVIVAAEVAGPGPGPVEEASKQASKRAESRMVLQLYLKYPPRYPNPGAEIPFCPFFSLCGASVSASVQSAAPRSPGWRRTIHISQTPLGLVSAW